MSIKSQKGLTLIEMVLSITLLAVIILTTVAILDFGQKSFVSSNDTGELQSEAQNAVIAISSMVRESSLIDIDDSHTRMDLDNNHSIEKNGNRLIIIYTDSNSVIKTLSENVDSVDFLNAAGGGVDIEITLSIKASSYTVKTTVYRRIT